MPKTNSEDAKPGRYQPAQNPGLVCLCCPLVARTHFKLYESAAASQLIALVLQLKQLRLILSHLNPEFGDDSSRGIITHNVATREEQ